MTRPREYSGHNLCARRRGCVVDWRGVGSVFSISVQFSCPLASAVPSARCTLLSNAIIQQRAAVPCGCRSIALSSRPLPCLPCISTKKAAGVPPTALSGSRLSSWETVKSHVIFVFGGAFSVSSRGRAFFFRFFLAWCLFFSYLCPWFSGLSRVGFPLPIGLFRGVGLRLLRRVRLVRLVRPARVARALLPVLGAGRRRVSAVRIVVVWSPWVFVVGCLVGGLLVRIACRGVGAVWWRSRV